MGHDAAMTEFRLALEAEQSSAPIPSNVEQHFEVCASRHHVHAKVLKECRIVSVSLEALA
jgi:hypothetical protein